MKIFVKANPSSKEEKIVKIDESHYVVYVKEPPIKGRANSAIIEALEKYFKASLVRIISGYASREKIIDIII